MWAVITVLALAVTACSAFVANAGAVRVSGTAVYDVNPLASRADLEAVVAVCVVIGAAGLLAPRDRTAVSRT